METNSTSAKTVGRWKRHKIFLSLLLLLIIVIFSLPALSSVAFWDGRFSLALNVSSSSGEKMDNISYATFSQREVAEEMQKYVNLENYAFRPAVLDNSCYTATIPCSGKRWIFNIETKYTEPRYIVVQVEYGNGKKSRIFAEIPEGRGPRSLTVSVP
jgi:hypothetical protein